MRHTSLFKHGSKIVAASPNPITDESLEQTHRRQPKARESRYNKTFNGLRATTTCRQASTRPRLSVCMSNSKS